MRGVRRSVVLALATAVVTGGAARRRDPGGLRPHLRLSRRGPGRAGRDRRRRRHGGTGDRPRRRDPRSRGAAARPGRHPARLDRHPVRIDAALPRRTRSSTFQCEFFSIGVTAPAAGTFGITVIQRDAPGTVVARSAPDPANPGDRLGQFVYAGVKIPSPPSTSSGPSARHDRGHRSRRSRCGRRGRGVRPFPTCAGRRRRRRTRHDDSDAHGGNDAASIPSCRRASSGSRSGSRTAPPPA